MADQTLRYCNLYDKVTCIDKEIARYKVPFIFLNLETKGGGIEGRTGVDFTCLADCAETCYSATYTPVLSYSMLSRFPPTVPARGHGNALHCSYNAEKILREEEGKIAGIREHFQAALEYNARFNADAEESDAQSFEVAAAL